MNEADEILRIVAKRCIRVSNNAGSNNVKEVFDGIAHKILFEEVMKNNNYNQTKSAIQLGMNRGCFRKYLIKYGLLEK